MAKINRRAANYLAFAVNALAGERTVFNSVVDSDVLDDNMTADFLRGWGIVSASEFPALEDFNAAFFTLGQTLAYLHQIGIAEWDVAQEYYQGSRTIGSDFSLYKLAAVSDTGTDPVGDVSGTWVLSTEGIGTDQTWQDVTVSRALTTLYTNTTSKPIQVVITANHTGSSSVFTVDGVAVSSASGTNSVPHSVIVPVGGVYQLTQVGGSTFSTWVELR